MADSLDLPRALRDDLKEPFGPLFTDVDAAIERAGVPLVAVGDIVTFHLLEAGHPPDVALVDERTERAAVDDVVRETVVGGDEDFDRTVQVENPAGTLTRALVEELVAAVDRAATTGASTRVVVDGEEDLAALPAILAVPAGGSVVYGQPGEGMVVVTPGDGVRETVADVLSRMDGDRATLAALEAV